MAQVRRVLCFEKTAVPEKECPWTGGRDVWWADVVPTQSAECEPEWLDAEDPLFLLYTSGSTGNPKAGIRAQLAAQNKGCLWATHQCCQLMLICAMTTGTWVWVVVQCSGCRGADLGLNAAGRSA